MEKTVKTEQKTVSTWVNLLKRKKAENLERAEYHQQDLKARLKQSSKYVLIAIGFDFIHYDLWSLFPEELHLYIYDATQSLSFLLYIYAIYKFFRKEETPIMYSVLSMWLWFSVGDCLTMVYGSKTIEGMRIEYYCLYLNLFVLSYKFRNYIYFYIELMRFNLKVEKYETVQIKI